MPGKGCTGVGGLVDDCEAKKRSAELRLPSPLAGFRPPAGHQTLGPDQLPPRLLRAPAPRRSTSTARTTELLRDARDTDRRSS